MNAQESLSDRTSGSDTVPRKGLSGFLGRIAAYAALITLSSGTLMANEAPSYRDLPGLSWSQVRALAADRRPAPYSVHIPINHPLSGQLIYCDKAFNVYTLPTPPNMTMREPKSDGLSETIRTRLTSFAFGKAPFIPDFRLSHAERKKGYPGVIVIRYFAWDLLYTMEYCTAADSSIRIRCTVSNTGNLHREAHVRTQVTHPRLAGLFPDQYVPFTWDQSNWQNDDSVFYKNNMLFTEDGGCAVIDPGKFKLEYERDASFDPEDHNKEFTFLRPYRVQPQYKLLKVHNALHFSAPLEPGDSCSFEMSLPTRPDSRPEGNFAQAEQENQKIWAERKSSVASVDFGDEKENEAFQAVSNCSLQLMIRRGEQLQPCQGGRGGHYYVWVWEAMEEMKAMISLGYFEETRRILEFFLSLQDSGVPPQGEFTTTDGSIGTTGPRWTNSTGSALILAAKYLLLSNDREFFRKHEKALLRAVSWIIGEIRATRVPGAINYGLMPKACATDGDFGYIYVFSDSYTCVGLGLMADVLARFKHPEAAAVAAEHRLYSEAIRAAAKRRSRPDGFIDRKLSDEGTIDYGFRNCTGATMLLDSEFSSADDDYMVKYVEYAEKNMFEQFFCGVMTYDVFYMGNVEKCMNAFYIQQGQTRKAWMTKQTFLKFAMTSDLHLTQERYCASDPAFTCWQPNGSGNGRFLEIVLNSIYMERGNKVYLLGGTAPFELRERGKISVTNLHTVHGRMNLEATPDKLRISWEKPVPAGTVIQLPDYFAERSVTLKKDTAELTLNCKINK